MRMSTDESRDVELACETIAAAADAGVTVFETAHAYGRRAARLNRLRGAAARDDRGDPEPHPPAEPKRDEREHAQERDRVRGSANGIQRRLLLHPPTV